MDLQAFKQLTTRVLAVTDDLGLHREGVTIPLDLVGAGAVRLLRPDRIEVIGPESDLDAFVARLPELIQSLDLSRVPRAESP